MRAPLAETLLGDSESPLALRCGPLHGLKCTTPRFSWHCTTLRAISREPENHPHFETTPSYFVLVTLCNTRVERKSRSRHALRFRDNSPYPGLVASLLLTLCNWRWGGFFAPDQRDYNYELPIPPRRSRTLACLAACLAASPAWIMLAHASIYTSGLLSLQVTTLAQKNKYFSEVQVFPKKKKYGPYKNVKETHAFFKKSKYLFKSPSICRQGSKLPRE